MELQTTLVLWIFALLAGGSGAFTMLQGEHASLMGTLVLLGAIGAVASTVMHCVVFKPMAQLVAMAEAAGAGDRTKRLRWGRRDQIGRLARALNAVCEQLEQTQQASSRHIAVLAQLRHLDRIATLGRLASSVAHELGNPLTVVELRAQLIASGEARTPHEAQQSAIVIVEQTRRMTRIIGEILSFARVRPPRIARLDLMTVLRRAIALSEHTSRKHGASIVLVSPQSAIEVEGDAEKILQVIVNLAANGIQAMPNGGTLRVSARSEHRPPRDNAQGAPRHYACVEVRDEGTGMPEGVLRAAFDPFFSTKGPEGGTGVGLSVAQGIAREHEGWIAVTSEPGLGSSFQVFLPIDGPTGATKHGA